MAKKEEHNHERGKIKKVISPHLLFFFGAFSSLTKKMRHQNRSFLACGGLRRHIFSCLFFSFSLTASTVPFLHSLFFSYLLNNRREKEREREV